MAKLQKNSHITMKKNIKNAKKEEIYHKSFNKTLRASRK